MCLHVRFYPWNFDWKFKFLIENFYCQLEINNSDWNTRFSIGNLVFRWSFEFFLITHYVSYQWSLKIVLHAPESTGFRIIRDSFQVLSLSSYMTKNKGHVTPLSLKFLIYKIGIIMLTSQGYWI